MTVATIQVVSFTALSDWKRTYTFDYSGFTEIKNGAHITSVSAPGVSGITVVAGSPGTSTVPVTISGGTIPGGQTSITYSGYVEATLNTTDVLSISYTYTVTLPGSNGINPLDLPKRTDWQRHYLFPYGKIFAEFTRSPAPTVMGVPVLTADAGPTYGTPVVSGTGTSVAAQVFISGGFAGANYNLRLTATLSDGSVLSIPGILTLSNP